MTEKLTPEQWEKIEERVGEAEKAERGAKKATVEIYRETGLTKREREESKKKEISAKAKRPRVAEKALEREEMFEQTAEDILGKEESPERVLIGLQKKNLTSALREEQAINSQKDKLLSEETDILKAVKEEPSGSELEALDEIRQELNQLTKKEEKLLGSSPEAYFGLHLKELKEYKKNLEQGRIVETPYVKKQIEDVVTHLRANKPVMIHGHLGSGKTELAMHIAKNYMGKEALVISGSKNISLAEFYGHQVLAIDKIPEEELDGFAKEVEQKYEGWVREHPKADENEKNRAHDRVLQTYLTQFEGGTISRFFLGPVYRAMAEGRPVIIDEVNAIPHEILISLNHLLTRQVGETINVQQDSGETVKIKEGFGVIMTGNLNQGQEKYIDRQDMDPAFLSRLYKIEYDYLPQKTEGSLKDEAGVENELLHLLLSKVMDKNGNLEAPADTVKKLWNLAKSARITQDVFAGREVNNAYYFKEAGSRSTKYFLKEAVLSIRALDNVVAQWQKEGYKKELDYYLWKEFVSQSTVASDRAYLYQLLKDQFGFFAATGWEQNPNYGSGGLVMSFDIKSPENPALKKEFWGPREIVEFAYGKAPKRAQWPEIAGKEVKEEMEELNPEIMKLEQFKSSFAKELKELGQELKLQ